MEQINRNKNVDILRLFACVIVIIYHEWVLTGSHPFDIGLMTLIVSLGGNLE